MHVPFGRGALALLLICGPSLACERTPNQTPLMQAAELGSTQLVVELISDGAPVDFTDVCGRTALMFAVAASQLDATKALLDAKANPNLHEKGFGSTAAHFAASIGSVPIMAALISAGADVNARDNYGDTPLMHAAAHGRDDVVRLLVASKADIAARRDGLINRNALHAAAYTGNGRTVSVLTDVGADPNERAE